MKVIQSKAGFTLIELTIVVVIASVVVAAALSIARPYYAKQQLERTASAVRTVDRALAEFLDENGRYPCPASLTAERGSAEDGSENCTADATGIFAANGQAHRGAGALETVAGGVLIGALPYRALNIPVSSTLDAASNRMTYAVSAASASNDPVTGYDDNLSDLTSSSAVLVVDESGTSVSRRNIDGIAGDEDLAKHYFFFSHGQNGVGAYSNDGVLSASNCGGSLDSENCDMDGTFVAAGRALGDSPAYNDDVSNESLLIEADLNESLWARKPTDEKNIYNLNTENVGVGTDNPTHHFHVRGGRSLGAAPFNPDNGVFKIEENQPAGGGPAASLILDGNQALASHGFSFMTDQTASNASNAENFLAFGTNDAERLRITFDGHVGIGTSSPNGSTGLVSNGKVNNVFSADRLVDIDLPGWSSQQDIQVRIGDLVLNSRKDGSSSVEAVKDRGANGNLVIGAVGSIVFNLQEKNSARLDDMEMYLTQDGFGIGVSDPRMPLHIQSDGNATAIISGFGDVETFSSLTLDSGDGDWLTDSWVMAFKKSVGDLKNSGLQFRRMITKDKNLTSLFLDNDGDVAIGHVSPNAKLDVAGEVKLSITGIVCDVNTEGAQRYNPKIKNMEFCDGILWRPFGATGPISCYGSQGAIACGKDFGCNSKDDHAQCPAGYIQVGMDICSAQRLGVMCQKF